MFFRSALCQNQILTLVWHSKKKEDKPLDEGNKSGATTEIYTKNGEQSHEHMDTFVLSIL